MKENKYPELDLGKKIQDYIQIVLKDTIAQVSIDMGYGSTRSLDRKLKTRHYGSTFDLIQISLHLNHNFFIDLSDYVDKKLSGVHYDELDVLESKMMILQEELKEYGKSRSKKGRR